MSHTKHKGNIGEVSVAKHLMFQGYGVFTELGDLCKTDLIAVDTSTGDCVKLQVKYRAANNNVVSISGRQAGYKPKYTYNYIKSDCDFFAVYCPDVDDVAYIPISMLADGKSLHLRLQESPYLNLDTYNWFKNYTSLKDVISGDVSFDKQQYDLPVAEKVLKESRFNRQPTKINWPSDQELVEMVSLESTIKVAKRLGVSDNAIRKRLISRGLWIK